MAPSNTRLELTTEKTGYGCVVTTTDVSCEFVSCTVATISGEAHLETVGSFISAVNYQPPKTIYLDGWTATLEVTCKDKEDKEFKNQVRITQQPQCTQTFTKYEKTLCNVWAAGSNVGQIDAIPESWP